MSYFDDRTDKDVSNPVHGEGDARRRSYELNDKYAGKDNTPSEENKPPEEDYSLNDDRRVKVLSPGTLVAKRFFRNRLAVVGLTILAVMFIFSFIGGSLPGLFAGALITETLFAIPGIGYISYNAMVAGDIPFSMFYMTFLAILTLLGNLISDILYAVVDPRVRIA